MFYAFAAMHGDAFMISSENSSILVDGGMPGTYGEIKRKILESKLDAVFVTHVDLDHIGGIVKLISDDEVDFTDCTFYMNHPDLVPYDDTGLVAYHHGDTLRKLTQRRSLKLEQVLESQPIIIGDFSIEVLSPKASDVIELHENWNASRVIKDGELSYKERQENNGDIINRSSIAKILKCGDISILLLADSHPETVVNRLITLGYSSDQPLVLDLVKLSHHGSQHNTSETLLKMLDCTNYYISTNGSRFNHPDAETITMLQVHAKNTSKVFNVYLNYQIDSEIISKCNTDLSNLKFIYQKEVVF
ncbi:ComEC/Rec2 family competence protein [Vibrio parahaemolyticus]|uniref:ComEC/Rec2 family competence protein n=1 Tax=Vibrio harveyi group TaxID=717610 RepID=UPI002284C9C6|nr:MBL fold metallo-hydrolase [Vibrio alginolyticus]MCR9628006.1 MBL fold metallo-hydrolase [Vibrio antiquarius]MCR9631632.1 MBL fold metallo-hydrolase [Vibrio antiquarius]MCY9818101.1 MBL fold metallo-hydrolase [Vibrio alginolyticus]